MKRIDTSTFDYDGDCWKSEYDCECSECPIELYAQEIICKDYGIGNVADACEILDIKAIEDNEYGSHCGALMHYMNKQITTDVINKWKSK